MLGVGLAELAREELDHAEHVLGGPDREAHRAAQPDLRRELGAGEVAVLDHVGHPARLAALPDPAGQAEARAQHVLAAQLVEAGRVDARGVPALDAAQDAGAG